MVKELMHDPIFLASKSSPATADDIGVVTDLLDTLKHHKDGCVGMAANMIGVKKCIIAFDDNGKYTAMLNPIITKASGLYEAQEGCLSLLGGPRAAKRYKKITVQFQNEKMQNRIKTFEGFTAQIIQHEIDHLNGILI